MVVFVILHVQNLVIFRNFNKPPLLLSPGFLAIFAPAVAKVYIVSFRTHDDRRPSKFIVLADSTKSAIKTAWEHGGADFQSRFDKSTGSPRDERRGATRSVRRWEWTENKSLESRGAVSESSPRAC